MLAVGQVVALPPDAVVDARTLWLVHGAWDKQGTQEAVQQRASLASCPVDNITPVQAQPLWTHQTGNNRTRRRQHLQMRLHVCLHHGLVLKLRAELRVPFCGQPQWNHYQPDASIQPQAAPQRSNVDSPACIANISSRCFSLSDTACDAEVPTLVLDIPLPTDRPSSGPTRVGADDADIGDDGMSSLDIPYMFLSFCMRAAACSFNVYRPCTRIHNSVASKPNQTAPHSRINPAGTTPQSTNLR